MFCEEITYSQEVTQMNFLSRMFSKEVKKSNSDVFESYVTLMLQSANVKVTDANRLKATIYLCFSQMACLHVLSKGASARFIDAMVEDVKKSILALKIKVKDLAQSEAELKRILSDFPKEAGVDGETTVNGLAAFEAIYFQYVEEVTKDIASHAGGPMGPHGYASIKFLEALKGEDNASDGMFEVSMLMTEMTGAVIKSFR
jgi:hypothetical protein